MVRFFPPQVTGTVITIIVLVTYTESTADMLAVAEMVDKDMTQNDLARGLATDGLSAVLAGFFNSFPDTAYAENVGLIGMTKVRGRYVVSVCGVFLLLLGLIPKVGAVVSDLPGPVIGGAATVMFAMVTSIGIRTLHKVEFEDNHNLLNIIFHKLKLFPNRQKKGAIGTAIGAGAVVQELAEEPDLSTTSGH